MQVATFTGTRAPRLLKVATFAVALPLLASDSVERLRLQPGDFFAPDLSGNTVQVSDWKGRVVFVTYWQTYCFPCRKELPQLDRLQARLGKRVLFVAINPWDDPARIAEFRNGKNPAGRKLSNLLFLTGRGSPGPFGLPAERDGIVGTPTTVILDRGGLVVARHVGPLNAAEAQKLAHEFGTAGPANWSGGPATRYQAPKGPVRPRTTGSKYHE